MNIVDCHTHYAMCWHERNGLDPENWLQAFDRRRRQMRKLYGPNLAGLLSARGAL